MKLSKKIISFVFITLCVLLFVFSAYFYKEVSGYKNSYKFVKKYSSLYGVDSELCLAVIKTESNFNKSAVSNKGAIGIMQIMPSTAGYISSMLNITDYDLFSEETNINFGIFYLSYLFKKFNDETLVILAYNAGEGNVEKWLKENTIKVNNVPFLETRNYLKKVRKRKFLYKVLI